MEFLYLGDEFFRLWLAVRPVADHTPLGTGWFSAIGLILAMPAPRTWFEKRRNM